MAVPSLIIAGVPIALQTFGATQTYRLLGGSHTGRKMSGAGYKQTHWGKLATTISGNGWAPPALAGVDWSVAVTIACAAPRVIHSATTGATLPAARRSDLAVNVLAVAVVANELVPTAVGMAGDVATATAVAGATGYQFMYFPTFSAFSDGPQESLDMTGAAYSWSLDAEEA